MKLALALILAMSTAAHAGGPVIIEEAYEAKPAAQNNHKIGGIVIGIIAIAALIALANGGDTCTVEETPVEPPPASGC